MSSVLESTEFAIPDFISTSTHPLKWPFLEDTFLQVIFYRLIMKSTCFECPLANWLSTFHRFCSQNCQLVVQKCTLASTIVQTIYNVNAFKLYHPHLSQQLQKWFPGLCEFTCKILLVQWMLLSTIYVYLNGSKTSKLTPRYSNRATWLKCYWHLNQWWI